MTIELGGNIVLEGFDSKDFTELIVVKKIVGQYARHLTDTVGRVEELKVSLSEDGGAQAVNVDLILEGEKKSGSASASNLFMALDNALKEVSNSP